jgi:hypothetical protein
MASSDYIEADERVAELIGDKERLRAALKPFADIGGRYPNAESDGKVLYHSNLGRLTLGDFRTAWCAMGNKN